MKTYTVVVTPEAKRQMRRHLAYIVNKLKNSQAAKNVYDDFIASMVKLSVTAGSIKEAEDEELIKRGLKRRNLDRHEYFVLFRVVGSEIQVTSVFHFRENYIAKLK